MKIAANDLEQVVAGSRVFLIRSQEEEEKYNEDLKQDLEDVRKIITLQKKGVCVSAPTLGSLEALLKLLNNKKIPVSYIGIGAVSKDDLLRSIKNVIVDNPEKRQIEYSFQIIFE